MSRKNKDFTREVLPDPKYGDTVITKTVNRIMRHGKKGIAEQALYVALDIVKEKSDSDPLPVFKKALDNIAPKVEVRSRRVGGATYQVPTDVRHERRQALAIRWLVEYANKRNEKNLSERLANELLEAAQNRGAAVKKREDTHKMADANKAFAHFKW